MPYLYRDIESPVGVLRLVVSSRGVRAILWGEEDERNVLKPDEEPEEGDHAFLDQLADQLADYFSGNETKFDLPLDLQGTDFQQTVWEALRDIPYGATISYQELAEHIGNPTAVRAVATAVGMNPVSIIIPCHRVIGSDGSLTGFAGGLPAKEWLLEKEGVL